MADSKITALTSISTSTDPANDPLVIVDVSDTSMAATGTTKKVTLNQLLATSPSATLASATITGDLTVDTNVLKVDTTNNRVGIGTATPVNTLEVVAPAGDNIVSTFRSGDATAANNAGGGFRSISSATAANRVAQVWLDADGANFSGGDYFFIQKNGGSGTVEFNQSSNAAMVFLTNSTERYRIASDGVATWSNVGGVAGTAMTLNSTGLGVGVASPTQKLHVKGVVNFEQVSGGTNGWQVYTYTDGTYRMNYNGAGADELIIDTSGNVGIGVTPSAWSAGKALEISSAGNALWSGTGYTTLMQNAVQNSGYKYGTTNPAARYDVAAGTHAWFTAPSGTAGTAITFTQAMTLDASGNLLVGTTDTSSTSGAGFKIIGSGLGPYVVNAASTNAALAYTMYSTGAAAYRFYVGWGGTVFATNTTISAISDARLKENVQDIDVGLGAILALKPRKFDWKAGKGKDIKGDRGFIAQEFEQVFPQLVDEWKDPAPEGEAPYKSVRQDLIPVLVKAIQELTARVQTLETR